VYIVQCVREMWYEVLGLRQINTCRKILHRSILLDNDIFCIAFYESYLSTGIPHPLHYRGHKTAQIISEFRRKNHLKAHISIEM
jgi:hypothetical protein